MALKEVANQSMILFPDDLLVVCTITILGIASLKGKILSQGIYQDGLQISVSAITYPSAGATIPDPGPYVVAMNAEAQKVKLENKLVLRVDDLSDTISATPQIPGSPPVDYPISFKIKITNAGQIKVKAQ
jgi:hypothetical protein